MEKPGPFLFFAADISYFSGKVRPALYYKHLPFKEVLPTPQAFQEVIAPRTGLAFVPILITPDDEVLQDSSDILDELERRFPDPPLYPADPVQLMFCLLVELYVDEFLLVPALHYRWSFPESEEKVRRDLERVTESTEFANRFADRMKGVLASVGVGPDMVAPIEAHTRELLDVLSHHFERYPYMLGDGMSLADCALMAPLYAHFYLDAVPGRLLRETAPRVCAWIERMNDPQPTPGSFVPDGEIPHTLGPLLALIGSDAIPFVLNTVQAFEIWADERPKTIDEPPRTVGVHRAELRGASVERYTSSYTLWMVQRPLDFYRSLPARQRTRIDRWLEGTGIETLLAHSPRHRLRKHHFKLAFEHPERQ